MVTNSLTIDEKTSLAATLDLAYIPKKFVVTIVCDGKYVQLLYGVTAIGRVPIKFTFSTKDLSKEQKTQRLCYLCVSEGKCDREPAPYPSGYTDLTVPANHCTMDYLHMILSMARHNLNLVAHAAVSCNIDIVDLLEKCNTWKTNKFPKVITTLRELKKLLKEKHICDDTDEASDTGSLTHVFVQGNIQACKFELFSKTLKAIVQEILKLLEDKVRVSESTATTSQSSPKHANNGIRPANREAPSQDPQNHMTPSIGSQMQPTEEEIAVFRFPGSLQPIESKFNSVVVAKLRLNLFQRIPDMLNTVSKLVQSLGNDFAKEGHLQTVNGLVKDLMEQRDRIFVNPTFPVYLHYLKDHLDEMVAVLPDSCKSFKLFQNQGTEAAHSAHKKTFDRVKSKCAFKLTCRWLSELVMYNLMPHMFKRMPFNRDHLPTIFERPEAELLSLGYDPSDEYIDDDDDGDDDGDGHPKALLRRLRAKKRKYSQITGKNGQEASPKRLKIDP